MQRDYAILISFPAAPSSAQQGRPCHGCMYLDNRWGKVRGRSRNYLFAPPLCHTPVCAYLTLFVRMRVEVGTYLLLACCSSSIIKKVEVGTHRTTTSNYPLLI